MTPILNPNDRPLTARLEAYTDDDPAFRQELIQLMISNLRELQEALSFDALAFERAAHKSKSTLTILDDPELNPLIEEFKKMDNPKNISAGALSNLLFRHIDHLIKDLENEAAIQKAS